MVRTTQNFFFLCLQDNQNMRCYRRVCLQKHNTVINVRSLPWLPAAGWSAERCKDDITLDWCTIKPLRRIGSKSRSAIVYEIVVSETLHAAMKLMVTGADADNEVAVATFLSTRVRLGESTRFPLVYGSTICLETEVDLMTNFGLTVKKIWESQFPDDTRQNRFPTHVLVSELMYEDVLQYFQHKDVIGSPEEAYIVEEVIEALRELLEARVHHGDLHLGNVLLHVHDDTIGVIVHDFGSSQLGCTDADLYELDLLTFLDCVKQEGRFISQVHAVESLCQQKDGSLEGFDIVLQRASSLFRAQRFQ
jgi:hypothetical protein